MLHKRLATCGSAQNPTMKFLSLLVLLLAVATAAAYISRKEYIYNYETLTVTGIPAIASQVAGLKLRCRIRAQFLEESRVLMKVETAELLKINDVLPTLTTTENEAAIPDHIFIRLTGAEVEEILEQLYKPISIRYNGVVAELAVDVSEPEWSINIKRGFLSVLNLNLGQTEAAILDDVPASLRDRHLHLNTPVTGHQEGPRMLYRALETDPVGECETIYALTSERTVGVPVPEFNLTKIRNYDSCVSKPTLKTGLMATLAAATTTKHKLPLDTTTHTDYQLVGSRHRFVIKKAFLHSEIVYSPLGVKMGEAVATIRSCLEHLDTVPITEPIIRPANMEETPPLLTQLPILTTLPTAADTDPSATATKIELVKTLVTEVVGMTEPFVDLAVPQKVAQIVFILNELPASELDDLLRFYTTDVPRDTENTASSRREFMLDVLPTLSRVDTVPLMRRLIRENIISPIRAIYMLNKLMLTATPSLNLPTDLLNLLDEPTVRENNALKKTIMLTTGSLIFKANRLMKDLHLDDAMHHITERIKRSFEGSSSEEEKLVWIKLMGNAGLLEFVPALEQCILDRGQTDIIRAKAIYSLRRMAPLIRRKVQALCLPIYLEAAEPQEVRVAAFLLTMKTSPSYSLLQLLAHSLTKETSLNMATFVYTYLEQLANVEPTPHSCNMTLHLQAIMKTLPPIRAGLIYSRTVRLSKVFKFMGDLDLNAELNLINDGTSIIPEALVARFSPGMMGSKMEMLELGLESDGWNTLLHQLSGSESFLSDLLEGKFTLEQLLHPFRSEAIYSHIQEIAEKLMLTERPLEMLDLRFYGKLFGNEIAFFRLDSSSLEELIALVRESIPELMHVLRTGSRLSLLKTMTALNNDLILPTASGLPLSLNTSLVTVAALDGHMRLTGIDSIFDLFTPNALQDIKLSTDIKTSMAVEMTGKMCVHLPYFKFVTEMKTQLNTKLPIKTELSLNLPGEKIQFTYDLPDTDETLFEYKMAPLTRVIKLSKTPTQDSLFAEEVKEFTTHDYILPQTLDLVVGESLLGVPVKVTGVYPQTAVSSLRPLLPWWAERALKLELLHSANMPTKLELELTMLDREMSSSEELVYRQSVPEPALTLTFEPVTADASLASGEPISMLLTAKPIGGQLHREMKLQLTYLMAADYLQHQLNLQLLTTPVISTATSPLKVVLETVLMIPDQLRAGLPLRLTEKELLQATSIKYGFTNIVNEVCNIQTFVGPVPNSEILLRTESPVLTPLLRQQFSQILLEPSLFNHLRPLMPQLPTTASAATTALTALTMEITYNREKIPAWFHTYLLKSYAMALKYLPTDPIPDILSVLNTPDKIELMAVLTPTQAMIVALLPSETLILRPITLPPAFWLPTTNTMPPQNAPRLLYLTEGATLPPGECRVSGGQLTTFDFVVHRLPEMTPQCELLLTQQCNARQQFAITMKTTAASNKKVVKLYLGNDTVELIPTVGGWFSYASYRIRVNNVEVTVSSTQPYIFTYDQPSIELFRIVKEGEKLTISSRLAPTIVTDLNEIIIQEGDLFRGQLCGLCGNFNSDQSDEMTGPRMESYETIEQLVASYVIPSDTCRLVPETERLI